MPKWELSSTDLHEYSSKIRKLFHIEEREAIDYEGITKLPDEIDRRRAIFKYFIPDVFSPGKYDRRMDLIDSCIYYIEKDSHTGNDSLVMSYWAKRAKVKNPTQYNPDDLEEGAHGLTTYHPIFHNLGEPQKVGSFLPKFVKFVQGFDGRKRKIDLQDQNLIFTDLFKSISIMNFNETFLQFFRILEWKLLELNPFANWLNLKDLMKEYGFKDIGRLHSLVNRALKLLPRFERGVFGLHNYTFYCPYPHHVRITFRGSLSLQGLLVGGTRKIQVVNIVIPDSVSKRDILKLTKGFPPQTEWFRLQHLRTPIYSKMSYYDLTRQDWIVPWDRVFEEWKAYYQNVERDENPAKPDYDSITPTGPLLKIAHDIEYFPNIKNRSLRSSLKREGMDVPLDEISRIRLELDQKALICRMPYLLHNKLAGSIVIRFYGSERWKLKLLSKILQSLPFHMINYIRNPISKTEAFEGQGLHTPLQGLGFIRTISRFYEEVLQDDIDIEIRNQFVMLFPRRSWYLDYYDPKTGNLSWDLADYHITPIAIHP